MLTGLAVAAPAAPALAADGSQFQAGFIISDSNFYDSDGMTEAEIQSFLDAMIGTCQNSLCLNILKQDTYSRPADRTVCAAYEGAAAEPVSRVIYKVQKACGISAKVLLVTLQKEMGLVTKKAPTPGQLKAAMGYACPDTEPCNTAEAGFYNQVYKAAWQFKRYSTPDVWGGYWAGQTRSILYSPNSGCGSKVVTIQNSATAALYAYTPYTPTAAALAAYPAAATGDDARCGSYGNRNFWFYYSDWFGSPTGIKLPDVQVDRVSGGDRFQTAVQISQEGFPDPVANPVSTVYIANGLDYPDALGAGPAAAKAGGPLLLVQPDAIPPGAVAEIQRLAPQKIVVVGGTGAVSDAVYQQLSTLAPVIRRDGGADRFATSREIAKAAFPEGSTTAYIATGMDFPDALAASAAAGANSSPVILVNGGLNALDPDTAALLVSLGVTKVSIAGGTAVVSSGIEAGLEAIDGMTVERFAGSTRYGTSLLINRDAFPVGDTGYDTVYVASGNGFPDALAGAALAGVQHAPLYLIPSTCLYTSMLQDLVDYGTTRMVILGGTGVIGANIPAWVNCS
jgi:putative cell wall-binding protein